MTRRGPLTRRASVGGACSSPSSLQRSILAIALVALMPAHVIAQEPGRTPAEVLRDAQRLGWRLRVVTTTDTLTGRLSARPTKDFRIGDELLDTAAVRLIQQDRKRGHGWLRGAVIGGAVTGLAVTGLFSVGPLANARPGIAAATTITLSGLGAVIGAAVGSAAQPGKHEWRTLWPTDESGGEAAKADSTDILRITRIAPHSMHERRTHAGPGFLRRSSENPRPRVTLPLSRERQHLQIPQSPEG